MIALIPARLSSKRVRGKNTRPFLGKPLIQWTLEAAIDSCCFDHIIVTTDSLEAGSIAIECGASYHKRPAHLATDTSTDIEWVKDVLGGWKGDYAILRPTSPYRDATDIRDAVDVWDTCGSDYTAQKSISAVSEHPAKCWEVTGPSPGVEGTYVTDVAFPIRPILPASEKKHLYERPTQTLMDAYVQTGAIDIARSSNLPDSIHGDKVLGFLLEGEAAIDINTEADWRYAESLRKESV